MSEYRASVIDDEIARQAKLHAALGEPVRLAIVDELSRSDRSPKELGERFGLRGNLLAHHLDVLEGAGFVERFTRSVSPAAGCRVERCSCAPTTPLDRSSLPRCGSEPPVSTRHPQARTPRTRSTPVRSRLPHAPASTSPAPRRACSTEAMTAISS